MSNPDEKQRIDSTDQLLPSTGLSPLARIGVVALDCSDSIEQEYGKDAQVLTVVVVAEVLARAPSGDYINSIEYASSEHRRWIQAALLREAVDQAEALNERRVAAVEEAAEERERPA